MKNLILGPFWVPLAQKFQNKILFKMTGCITFEVKWNPNFSQKTKKFLQLVPKINSRQTEKRPNGQMDWGISQDLHFEGLKRKIWSIVENIVVSIIYSWQNAIFNEIWRQTLQKKMFIGVLYNSCSEKSRKFYRNYLQWKYFSSNFAEKCLHQKYFSMNFA